MRTIRSPILVSMLALASCLGALMPIPALAEEPTVSNLDAAGLQAPGFQTNAPQLPSIDVAERAEQVSGAPALMESTIVELSTQRAAHPGDGNRPVIEDTQTLPRPPNDFTRRDPER